MLRTQKTPARMAVEFRLNYIHGSVLCAVPPLPSETFPFSGPSRARTCIVDKPGHSRMFWVLLGRPLHRPLRKGELPVAPLRTCHRFKSSWHETYRVGWIFELDIEVRSEQRASGSTTCFGNTGDRCVQARHRRLQCSTMLTSQVRLSIRPSLSRYRSPNSDLHP